MRDFCNTNEKHQKNITHTTQHKIKIREDAKVCVPLYSTIPGEIPCDVMYIRGCERG